MDRITNYNKQFGNGALPVPDLVSLATVTNIDLAVVQTDVNVEDNIIISDTEMIDDETATTDEHVEVNLSVSSKVDIIRSHIRDTVYIYQGLHVVKYMSTTATDYVCSCNCKAYVVHGYICSHSLVVLELHDRYNVSMLAASLCAPKPRGRPRVTTALELWLI